MKKYSDIIVELRDTVDLRGYKIIEVKDFLELVDVEEEILVYICSKIDKENKEISFQQINNYICPFENYYQEIEKIKEYSEEDFQLL